MASTGLEASSVPATVEDRLCCLVMVGSSLLLAAALGRRLGTHPPCKEQPAPKSSQEALMNLAGAQANRKKKGSRKKWRYGRGAT